MGSNGPLLDTDSKRLLELTTSGYRSTDGLEEIITIVSRKAPKLLDGLTESNKQQIAFFCQLKLCACDEVVFHQGGDPDGFYTVLRGAVSIYAKRKRNNSSNEAEDNKGRGKYGVFLTQLPPGESFGELSFNGDGDHSKRNASALSDGNHGDAHINEVEPSNSDVCVLFFIPKECYMSELFARHSAKHQTKDKINLLKTISLFQHWEMDQLVKLAYSMKKKGFEKGSIIIEQGVRMDHLWIIKQGLVRVSHRVIPPNSIDAIQRDIRSGRMKQKKKQLPLSVDIADIGATDAIGLTESVEESVKKSQREAVALTATEMFFVPISFFKTLLDQDSRTFSLVKEVVERRRKWELLRSEYAVKFPHMNLRLPKDAALMSNYGINGCNPHASKMSRNRGPSSVTKKETCANSIVSPNRHQHHRVRQSKIDVLDRLANEAGLSCVV